MSVDWMRRIDRWAGVPICFVLTLVRRFASLFKPSPDRSAAPRHVLFVELPEMGSLVLACPAIRRLQADHPGARVSILVFARNRESAEVLDLTRGGEVLTIDPSSMYTLARDTVRLIGAARRLGIDTTINLEMFARFSTILCFLSGARTRVGFAPFGHPGLYAGDLLTHRVIYNPHLHTSQAFLALVAALGKSTSDLPMGKFPTPDLPTVAMLPSSDARRAALLDRLARENPKVAGKRLIVINPNASELITVRKWPLENYAQLTDRLLEDPGYACVITGVQSERPDAQFIRARVKSDRLVDFTGKTTIRELLDLFNVSDVLVTNDSGPAQYAALTSTHVVVFFGPETPALYKPLTDRCTVLYSRYACSPCVSAFNQRRTDCTDNACLKVLQVDAVYKTIREILAARAV